MTLTSSSSALGGRSPGSAGESQSRRWEDQAGGSGLRLQPGEAESAGEVGGPGAQRARPAGGAGAAPGRARGAVRPPAPAGDRGRAGGLACGAPGASKAGRRRRGRRAKVAQVLPEHGGGVRPAQRRSEHEWL